MKNIKCWASLRSWSWYNRWIMCGKRMNHRGRLLISQAVRKQLLREVTQCLAWQVSTQLLAHFARSHFLSKHEQGFRSLRAELITTGVAGHLCFPDSMTTRWEMFLQYWQTMMQSQKKKAGEYLRFCQVCFYTRKDCFTQCVPTRTNFSCVTQRQSKSIL